MGPKEGFTVFKDALEQPSRIEAASALPLAFHPAGYILLWEDAKHLFHYSLYDDSHWEKSVKLDYPYVSGGGLAMVPNGLTLLHWRPGAGGVTLIADRGRQKEQLAAQYRFLSTPHCLPDGRGIVGPVAKGKATAMVYVPVRIPLADVANAWMFARSKGDQQLLEKNGGLLRDLPDDQLYSLCESEAYSCGQYSPSIPTRPYLVTTDVFWELFGAAYEGIFIVRERQQAIPAFSEFVREADGYFSRVRPSSPWRKVFSLLMNLHQGGKASQMVLSEVQRIRKADGKEFSPILGKPVDFGELKVRGHYGASREAKSYFEAFEYLTLLAGEALPLDDLSKMDPGVREKALWWIGAYDFLIAPSRTPMVWKGHWKPPSYAKHPVETRIFPLSWGLDNEILLSTVFHPQWPESEQVKGPSGPRLLPSALGVGTAIPDSSVLPTANGVDKEAEKALSGCHPKLAPGLLLEAERDGKILWKRPTTRVVSIQPMKVEIPRTGEYLFTLERHFSEMDEEEGLRPCVYEVRKEGFIPKWKGTALAWPVLDAALLTGSKRGIVRRTPGRFLYRTRTGLEKKAHCRLSMERVRFFRNTRSACY